MRFSSIDETPKGKTCDAIMGILDEGKEIMDEYKGMPALDAGLLPAAQAVEHYEISVTAHSRPGRPTRLPGRGKLLDATLKKKRTSTAR